ncbi:hypothetical protein BDR07DRAFT_1411764 [Suillus spraguei]|nr:hypothetical protein BDR07DRAFT_1411764 [Suillus spraguei]
MSATSFYNLAARKRVAMLKSHILSLTRQMLDRGSRFLSAGDTEHPLIPECDTFTRKEVGHVLVHPLKSFSTLRHLISCFVAAKPPSQAQVSKSMILAITTKSTQPSWTLASACSTAIANCSRPRLDKMSWDDVLLDAQKLIELEPSLYAGCQLNHAVLHGAQYYSQTIEAAQITVFAKFDSAHDTHIRKLREKYISPSKAESDIQKFIDSQLYSAPFRLLNTTTGCLCDRGSQISAFKTSSEYNDLLSSIMTHPDFPVGTIADTVATYFRYVMLSHRWGENEPLLHDIQDKVVYKLKEEGALMKLQSFCKVARDAGYHWAWVDTCCIDQNNHVELQKSLNSAFVWYHHSALTIVYLSDVPPSAKSGALVKSEWNTRGWTVPEFLAPKTIRFCQQDWTPYLGDHSPNHKESIEIMHEMEDATCMDARALNTFQSGMRDARVKLQLASTRVTTVPEDIAYSLFGIFGIQLPILYGENAQNALGRLLQEIVARCLPANIFSYAAPPCTLPYLSEDEIQTRVSSLQHTVTVDKALKLYTLLENINAPRFTNCRLRLPCISFRVTEVRWRPCPAQETSLTYAVKADGLDDLLITTEERLVQFSRLRPTRQTFLLVRPWDRRLLELPDFPEHAEHLRNLPQYESPLDDFDESTGDLPGEEELADSESYLRALRLIARLGQPFSAFLLAQQRGGEYKRIACDYDVIAQVKEVKDMASAYSMDIRTLEIL